MAKTYSADLRSRVIDYVERGNLQKSASELFKISTTTVSKWWLQYKLNGAKHAKPKGGSKGKTNLATLEEFMEKNDDNMLKEIAKHFNVSITCIHRRLKQLKFSYKKKLSPM